MPLSRRVVSLSTLVIFCTSDAWIVALIPHFVLLTFLFPDSLSCHFIAIVIRCGHCKSLAPDWDTLASTYASSSSVLIGSVDCTAVVNEDLCQEHGVSGYPTLKYFIDGHENDYQGARSLEALETFVSETLDKKCLVGTDEEMSKEESNCSGKETDYARKMRSKSAGDRKAQIDRLEKMKNGSMKPELKTWLLQRLHVLKGIESLEMEKDEF